MWDGEAKMLAEDAREAVARMRRGLTPLMPAAVGGATALPINRCEGAGPTDACARRDDGWPSTNRQV